MALAFCGASVLPSLDIFPNSSNQNALDWEDCASQLDIYKP